MIDAYHTGECKPNKIRMKRLEMYIISKWRIMNIMWPYSSFEIQKIILISLRKICKDILTSAEFRQLSLIKRTNNILYG